MYEWVVAQELWRQGQLAIQKSKRRAIDSLLEADLKYWASNEHEIDFVLADGSMIEVKGGQTDPREFAWFSKVFPGKHLSVVSDSEYQTKTVSSTTLERFLLAAPSDLFFDSDRAPWLFEKE